MAQVQKIDSQVTGLRYVEEASIKVLPGAVGSPPTNNTGTWKPVEPNSYPDFGGNLTLIARNPISADRQRKKGVITDLDATSGWNEDVTQTNMEDLLQGFMFADLRPKGEEVPTAVVTTDTYEMASTTGFQVGSLIFASGFSDSANNGLKRITAVSVGVSVTVAETLVNDAAPGTGVKIVAVGFQGAAGDIDVDVTGTWPKLTSTALDFTTLGILPGEPFFVGGDLAADQFTNAENNGFKRARSVATNALEIDKSVSAMVIEGSTTETIRIFFGRVLKNETGALIKRRTYQFERTLGAPDDASPAQIQAEYLVGSVPNEFTLQVAQADILKADLSFVSSDHEIVDGATTLRSAHAGATAPAIVEADGFNTSSDFSRIKMHQFVDGSESPAALFAFITDMTLNINNNVTLNKAVGVLGGFDATAGTFAVGGSLNGYFSNVSALTAVRNNQDISMDIAIVKANAGIMIDIPLIALGDGRANVELDQSIRIPLTSEAASGSKIDSSLNHTLLFSFFDYLPTAADV